MKQIEILLYNTANTKAFIEVIYEDETFWMSQKKMAELFGVDVRTVNEHLKNIYSTSELDPEATIRNFRIVQTEGAPVQNQSIKSNYVAPNHLISTFSLSLVFL